MTTPAPAPNAAADAFQRGDEINYRFTVPGLPDVGTLTNSGVVTGTSSKFGVTVAWYGGGTAVFSDVGLPLVSAQGRISELTRTGQDRLGWLESGQR